MLELDKVKEKLLFWRDNPVDFCEEVFNITLEKWQREVLNSIVKNDKIAVRSSHGVGKSALASWIMLWFLSTRSPAKIICSAPTAVQLFTILWSEISIWLRKSNYNFSSLFQITEDSLALAEAPKENFAKARTGKKESSESMQGAHSKNLLYVIDECSGVHESIFPVIEGSLSTEGSKIIMFSNPTRTSGYFYEAFHKKRGLWKTFHVSSSDSSQVSKKYVEDMAKSYGTESNIYRVRCLGDFPKADDDCVIGLDVIESAIDRDISPFGEVVWGADIARYGSARTAVAKRQGAKLLEEIISWSQRDTMETSNKINKMYQDTNPNMRPSKIVIDIIGLGSGVADRLKEMGLPVVALNVAEVPSQSEKFLRLRDELWFEVRDWFMNKIASIPEDQVLISELSSPKYSITQQGKIKVETKEEMKKRGVESPDCADAFVMTFCKEKPRITVKREEKKRDMPNNWMAF